MNVKPKWYLANLLPLFLGASLAALHAQSGSAAHVESLRLVQPYLWLGYVPGDQSIAFTFEVRNDSDVAVKIVSAEASCRCTSLEGKPPESIPGHGKGVFKWIFNTARSEGGMESKEITITTAEGKDLVGKFEAWVAKPNEAADKPKATNGAN